MERNLQIQTPRPHVSAFLFGCYVEYKLRISETGHSGKANRSNVVSESKLEDLMQQHRTRSEKLTEIRSLLKNTTSLTPAEKTRMEKERNAAYKSCRTLTTRIKSMKLALCNRTMSQYRENSPVCSRPIREFISLCE